MKFKIPFTIADPETLKRRSKNFSSHFSYKKESSLGEHLKNVPLNMTREEYLGICLRTFIISFSFLFVVSVSLLFFFHIRYYYIYASLFTLSCSLLIFFNQRIYPQLYVARKQQDIERNLYLALEDILIQLNSGIPLYNILVNISDADYGVLSMEFKKAVKRINAGESEAAVLDELGKRNPSIFFRRVLWQISNGMRSGSDMSIIIRDSVKTLNEEQLIQIQNYSNRLNPLVVFYMLIAVIIPSLSITFLTIISSMVNMSSEIAMGLFIGLFFFDVIIQIMFLGLIKSRRPSLL
jgi:flagellar protein FlaJ